MPKVVSQRQRLANRQNAQKSAGPRTPRGKARSALNAVKHGLLAKSVVIDKGDGLERRADFDALLAGLIKEFKPKGLAERVLVERLATSYWRLRRAHRFEVGAVRDYLDDCMHPGGEEPDEQTTKIEAQIQTLNGEIAVEQALLDTLEAVPEPKNDENLEPIKKDIKELASQCKLPDGFNSKSPLPQLYEVVLEIQREHIEWQQQQMTALQEQLDAAQRSVELRQSRRPLVGSLPADNDLNKLVRFESMLDRQFHRALTALRNRPTKVTKRVTIARPGNSGKK